MKPTILHHTDEILRFLWNEGKAGKELDLEQTCGKGIPEVPSIVKIVAGQLILMLLIPLLFGNRLFAESIRLGYLNLPPEIMKKEGVVKPEGALVRFWEERIAPEMGVDLIWAEHPTSLDRHLFQLERNEVDAGVILAKVPERLRFLDYPRNPFLETSPCLALLKNHPLREVHKVEDVLGLRIGTMGKAFISPFMRDRRIKFEFVYTDDATVQVFKKLLAGRIDAHYQLGVPALLYLARILDAEDKIKIVRLPEKTVVYTAFSKKADRDLAARYDRAFEKVGGMKTFIECYAEYLDIGKL
jgi:ABC-type amino acid transport substrate-binding protein